MGQPGGASVADLPPPPSTDAGTDEALKASRRQLITETGFSCMADLLLKLRKLPLEMSEIPLELRYDRRGGASKMRVIRTIRQTLFLMLRRRFGQL